MNISKGIALAMGRDYVIPDDVSYICRDVLAHRIILSSKARLNDSMADDVILDILKNTPVPKIAGGK